MKKNIFTYALLISLSLVNFSCKKFLSPSPTDFLTPQNYFQNQTQIDAYLASVYDAMNQSGGQFYQTTYPTIISEGTDETYIRVNTTIPSAAHYNTTANDASVTGFWNQVYVGINRANTLLENIDHAPISAIAKNHAIGEARFLRAYYHFILTQCFGDIPLRIKSTQSTDDVNLKFTPQKQVYDYVIAEMTACDDLLKDQTPQTLNYTERVTSTAVEGILARVCLFAAGQPVNDIKRYNDALTWASKAVNSGQCKLASDYKQLFINESADAYDNVSHEMIWEVGFSWDVSNTGLREGNSTLLGITNADNLYGQQSGQELMTALAYRAFESFYNPAAKTDLSPDLRRDWSIAPFSYTGGVATPAPTAPTIVPQVWNSWWVRYPGKWRRQYETAAAGRDKNNSPQNLPLLRYADVLLMLAEADNAVNGPTMVGINAVNQVRERAYGVLLGSQSIQLTLKTAGSGYTTAPTGTIITGGGGNGVTVATTLSGGTVSSITMSNPGTGFSAVPGNIYLGNAWAPSVAYALNAQVVNNGLLYTVTKAGTSTNTPPTNTSGSSVPATTGATFTYAGNAATASATLLNGDMSPEMYAGKGVFLKTIQDERMRELSSEMLRKYDLKRWGLLVSGVKDRVTFALQGNNAFFPDGTQTILPIAAASAAIATADGNIDGRWIYLPVPGTELSNNKLAKQNPGF
jgi:hypothetical protein